MDRQVQIRIRGEPALGIAFSKWVSKYQEEIGRKVSQEEAAMELLRRVGVIPRIEKPLPAQTLP